MTENEAALEDCSGQARRKGRRGKCWLHRISAPWSKKKNFAKDLGRPYNSNRWQWHPQIYTGCKWAVSQKNRMPQKKRFSTEVAWASLKDSLMDPALCRQLDQMTSRYIPTLWFYKFHTNKSQFCTISPVFQLKQKIKHFFKIKFLHHASHLRDPGWLTTLDWIQQYNKRKRKAWRSRPALEYCTNNVK